MLEDRSRVALMAVLIPLVPMVSGLGFDGAPRDRFARVVGQDHEPFIRIGPFRSEIISERSNVALDPSGVLTLEPVAGGYRQTGWVVFEPVHLDQPANWIQVGHVGQMSTLSDILVEARVRTSPSEPFSNWLRLDREGELVVARPVVQVQVRLVLLSTAGRETPRAWEVSVSSGLSAGPTPVAPGRRVAVAPPEMVTRSAWGARQPRRDYTPHAPAELIIHHSSAPTAAAYRGAATIRGIQDFHMDGRGWDDIGYHFVIGPEGRIYEARPEGVVGSHCPPNPAKIGICMIGNYEAGRDTLTPASLESLRHLLTYLCGKHQLSADAIFPHRKYRQTDCPGQQLFERMPAIRADVRARLQAGE